MAEIDILGVRDKKRGVERSELERNDEPLVADLFGDVRCNLDFILDALFVDRYLIRNEESLASPVSQGVL
jgi:hypothetical protein